MSSNLKQIKIESDDSTIHIECPHCDTWEQLGIDDPRHRLSSLPITKWLDDTERGNEISRHECTQCKNEFEVEWDYNNPML